MHDAEVHVRTDGLAQWGISQYSRITNVKAFCGGDAGYSVRLWLSSWGMHESRRWFALATLSSAVLAMLSGLEMRGALLGDAPVLSRACNRYKRQDSCVGAALKGNNNPAERVL